MKKSLLLTALLIVSFAKAQNNSAVMAEAKSNIDNGDLLHAQKILQPVLDQSPDDAEANYLMARSYTSKRNFRQAAPYIDKAINNDPANITYRKLRVNSLTSASSNEDIAKGISDLNYMLANGERSAKIYNALGSAEKDIATNILRHSANKSDATYQDAIKHYELAKSAYSKALELDQANKVKFEYEIKQLDNNVAEAKKLL